MRSDLFTIDETIEIFKEDSKRLRDIAFEIKDRVRDKHKIYIYNYRFDFYEDEEEGKHEIILHGDATIYDIADPTRTNTHVTIFVVVHTEEVGHGLYKVRLGVRVETRDVNVDIRQFFRLVKVYNLVKGRRELGLVYE